LSSFRPTDKAGISGSAEGKIHGLISLHEVGNIMSDAASDALSKDRPCISWAKSNLWQATA
jgi:hypothetical protein